MPKALADHLEILKHLGASDRRNRSRPSIPTSLQPGSSASPRSRVSMLIVTTSKSLPPSLPAARRAPAFPRGTARTTSPTG